MNNPDLKYDINPFVCFGEYNRSGLLESEGDISTGLFKCYFIKLKEFTAKRIERLILRILKCSQRRQK